MLNNYFSIIFGIVSIVLVYIILIQSSNNSGFQEDPVNISERIFFSKSNGVEYFLKKITIIFVIIFFSLAIILTLSN